MLSFQFYLAIGIIIIALLGGAIAWNYMVLTARIDDDRKRRQDLKPRDPDEHSSSRQ